MGLLNDYNCLKKGHRCGPKGTKTNAITQMRWVNPPLTGHQRYAPESPLLSDVPYRKEIVASKRPQLRGWPETEGVH